MVPTSLQQQLAAESLYRDANSLLYADNKPSEEAIDRVISKINKEYVFGLPGLCTQLSQSTASTRRASSRGSGRTRTRETSRTSMNATVCSTRRQVFLYPCVVTAFSFNLFRLHDTMTSTQQKFVLASSVAPLCDCVFVIYLTSDLVYCYAPHVLYCPIYIINNTSRQRVSTEPHRSLGVNSDQ